MSSVLVPFPKALLCISQAFEESCSLVDVEDCTIVNRARAFDLLVEHFGDIPVSQLTKADVIRWRKKFLVETMDHEASTANKHMASARSVFTVLVDADVISVNPFLGIKRLKEDTPIRFIEWDNCLRLLEYANREYPFIAIVLAVYAGYRLNEIRAARWEHFDWEERKLWVEGTKTDSSSDWVPLHDAIYDALLVYRRESGLIVDKSENQMWRDLRRVARAAGVVLPKGMAWHALRHSFVVHLQDLGYTQAQMARLVRHKNTRTIHRYADVRAVVPTITAF